MKGYERWIMLAVILLAGIAVAIDHRSHNWPKPGTEETVFSDNEPTVETGGYDTGSGSTDNEPTVETGGYGAAFDDNDEATGFSDDEPMVETGGYGTSSYDTDDE